MKNVLLYLWQLPQNLLGLLFLLFIRGEERHSLAGISFYYCWGFCGGISLGKYIILGEYYEEDVKHEFGHSIQSKRWGWLYLPVVGLCSLTWAGLYGTLIKETLNGYYKFWTERNADKLGGVKRR
jgi:hypothetical protein